MPQKILGQTYEKLRIRSDLGTSEENLTLNLRKTFDQCSIRSFGSAVLDPQITRYTRSFSPQLCSANYPLQHPQIRTSTFYPRPSVIPDNIKGMGKVRVCEVVISEVSYEVFYCEARVNCEYLNCEVQYRTAGNVTRQKEQLCLPSSDCIMKLARLTRL